MVYVKTCLCYFHPICFHLSLVAFIDMTVQHVLGEEGVHGVSVVELNDVNTALIAEIIMPNAKNSIKIDHRRIHFQPPYFQVKDFVVLSIIASR